MISERPCQTMNTHDDTINHRLTKKGSRPHKLGKERVHPPVTHVSQHSYAHVSNFSLNTHNRYTFVVSERKSQSFPAQDDWYRIGNDIRHLCESFWINNDRKSFINIYYRLTFWTHPFVSPIHFRNDISLIFFSFPSV